MDKGKKLYWTDPCQEVEEKFKQFVEEKKKEGIHIVPDVLSNPEKLKKIQFRLMKHAYICKSNEESYLPSIRKMGKECDILDCPAYKESIKHCINEETGASCSINECDFPFCYLAKTVLVNCDSVRAVLESSDDLESHLRE